MFKNARTAPPCWFRVVSYSRLNRVRGCDVDGTRVTLYVSGCLGNEISRSSLVLDVNTIIDKSTASFTPNTSSCPATLKAKSSPPPGDPSQDRTPVTSSLASTQPSRHEAQPR
ncbi:hypothetical protein HBH98_178880 [Parastagonospora nodorum]|nr:hypothetical protein HBH52_091760 [Parastagonospora nodorum]KAH4002218.1 hypothetical protein HBI10_082430 [Parastagonospora nodorum]KAH4031798.1 hypothetical protein HBI13_015690 [Parastagonospora nodorum]KAH4047257.1 hypothetical protein HBH49_171750 [Parastagonospora nodorum]KAH4075846.1 hypothetical protein HBH50_022460 [Parastagonospora nodorum]